MHSGPTAERYQRLVQFSSSFTRKVDKTTDIDGKLPNAVFTLPPHLVHAIVGLADVTSATREALMAECKKFYLAFREHQKNKEVFVDRVNNKHTTVALDGGRLYAEGSNRFGQCGIGSEEPEVTGPRLIRLPTVLQVWHSSGRWLAKTSRGLYGWGLNNHWDLGARLGLGDDELILKPRRVPIDGAVLEVKMTLPASFIRTGAGWFGCGHNQVGQLGAGHCDKVTAPAFMRGSKGVTRWIFGKMAETIFGETEDGILACGINGYGNCGVGSTDNDIYTLTPVALPDDVKGRVDRVVFDEQATFFVCGRRCFGCGENEVGQLGVRSETVVIRTPAEMPVPVDDIVSDNGVTVIRSGDTLLACGHNELNHISSTLAPMFPTPTPIDLPGPIVKAYVSSNVICVQLPDGAWVGRGMYNDELFTPVPEEDLVIVADDEDSEELDPCVNTWTPVTEMYAELLNTRGTSNMIDMT